MGAFSDRISSGSGSGGGTSSRGVGGAFSRGLPTARKDSTAPSGAQSQTRQLAYNIAKLRITDPEKAKKYDSALASLPEEDLKAAGLSKPKKKGTPLWKRALSPVGDLLEVLDRPSQAVLSLIRNSTSTDLGDTLSDAGRALGGKGGGEEGRINFRDATGMDKDSGGFLGDVADLVGTVATDPLSYLTLGTGSAAKAALKNVSKEVSPEVARRISSGGLRSLPKHEQEAVRSALEKAAAAGGKVKNPAKTADRQMRTLGRRAQGGVGLGARGSRVTLMSSKTAGQVGEATGLSAVKRAVKSSAPVTGLADKFVPRAAITRALGSDVADIVYDAKSKAEARLGAEQEHVVRRLTKAAEDARLTPEDQSAILNALDVGGSVPATVADLQRQGKGAAASLLTELDAVRRETGDALVSSGLARPNTELHAIGEAAREKGKTARIEQAMKGLPKAAKSAESARKKADRAADALDAARVSVSDRNLTGLAPKQPGEAVRLDRALRSGSAERLAQVEEAIEEARRLRESPATFAQGVKLGKLAERARITENIAKSAEARYAKSLATSSTSQNKVLADRVRRAGDQAARGAMTKARRKELFLMDTEDYVPRVATKEAKKQEARLGRPPTGMSQAFNQGGAIKVRSRPTASIEELNEAAGYKMFETNPVGLVAKRAVDAQRAVSERSLLEDLAGAVLPDGTPLVIKGGRAADRPQDYVKIKAGSGGDWYAPAPIAKDLEAMQALVVNDDALKSYGEFLDRWQKAWKANATLPIVGGVSFFSRNAQTNLLLNYIAGYKSPRLYAEATKIQRAVGRVKKGTGKVDEASLRAAGLDERQAKIVLDAVDEGVLNTGFFDTDLASLGSSKALREGGRRTPLEALADNRITRPGKKINSAVENNARLAHFIGALEATGSVQDAALSVKKYLFDYGDLTPFERTVFKRTIGFYTFMRKNTALMVGQAVENPGRLARIERTQDTLLNDEDGSTLGSGLAPDYAIGGGQAPLRSGLARALSLGGSTPIVGRLDGPVSSAIETVLPAVQAAALVPGLRELLPESLRHEDGAAGVARGVLNVPSGGPVELVKFLAEQTTGQSLFTGAPLQDDKATTVRRLASILTPLYAKEERLLKAAKDVADGGDTADASRVKLLNALLGLSTTTVDEKATKASQTRANFAIQDALTKLKEKGVNVPTVDELREAGIMPENAASPRRSGGSGGGGAFSRGGF